MSDSTGRFFIVFNGEITIIRKSLKKLIAWSSSKRHPILKLFLTVLLLEGKVLDNEGQFSFVIWDTTEKQYLRQGTDGPKSLLLFAAQ